jgi:putative transposase
MYPLVLDLTADSIPVTVHLPGARILHAGLLCLARQPGHRRDWDDAHLTNAAVDIHHDDPAFVYRFIADELAEQGLAAGENRVARLCSQ